MGLTDDMGFSTEGEGFSTQGEGFGSGGSGESFESQVSSPSGFFGGRRSRFQPVPHPDSNSQRQQERENPYDVFRDRRDQALERLRNPPGFDNRAIVTWGEGLQNLPVPTEVTSANGLSDNFLNGSGFKTVPKSKSTSGNNSNNGTVEWSEQKRVVKVIKVASEENPDTYIKVKVPLASVIQTDEKTVVVRWLDDTGAPGAGASTNDEEEDE